MEIIQKIGLWYGSFNILKEYIPKSIEKERWTDILPRQRNLQNSSIRKKNNVDL